MIAWASGELQAIRSSLILRTMLPSSEMRGRKTNLRCQTARPGFKPLRPSNWGVGGCVMGRLDRRIVCRSPESTAGELPARRTPSHHKSAAPADPRFLLHPLVGSWERTFAGGAVAHLATEFALL